MLPKCCPRHPERLIRSLSIAHTDCTPSYCCITLCCNAISKWDHFTLSFDSRTVCLSEASERHSEIGRSLLAASALRFSPVPVEYQPVKRWNRQSVFAVMVNEGDDSECENVLMTPLREALPLNLDEALLIRSLPTLSTAFAGFPMMLMRGFHLCNDVKLCCRGQQNNVPQEPRQAVTPKVDYVSRLQLSTNFSTFIAED